MAKKGRIVKIKRANRRGMLLGVLVVVILAVVFTVGIIKLRKDNRELLRERNAIQENVLREQEIQESLDAKEDGTLSKDEIEDIARERFGLAYPNEIIFVPED